MLSRRADIDLAMIDCHKAQNTYSRSLQANRREMTQDGGYFDGTTRKSTAQCH